MKTNAQWCLITVIIGLHCSEQTGNIQRPPKIIQSPKREETFKDSSRNSFTLDCKAEGTPKPTYEWKKDGSILNLNLQKITKGADGSITINGLKEVDEGFYQCEAHNQHGTAVSDFARLRMAFLRTTSRSIVEMTFDEGQPFQLDATPPESFPRPTFSWETAISAIDLYPIPLHLSQGMEIDEDGNLHFACAKPEHELESGKIYKSTSFNAIADEKKSNNYAKVKITRVNGTSSRAPKLGFSSKNVTIALVGKPLILRCFFNGCPIPTDVTWESSSKAAREKILSKHGTELKINNVTVEHGGSYHCSGTNSVTKTTHTITVRVEAEPRFNQDSDAPRDINITEGESVTINCIADATPEAGVTWYKNGKRFDGESLPTKYSLTNGGKSLVISDVCRDCHAPDLTVIQCNASNVHGYAFAAGYINVLKRTEVTVSGPPEGLNVSVEFGKENVFTFSCSVKFDPITVVQPLWYKWTEKGYKVLLPSEDYPNATLEDNALTIRFPSNLNDTWHKWEKYLGKYFCLGDNKYTSSSKSVFVDYKRPPTVPPPPEPPNILLIAVLAAVLLFLLILMTILCCCWYWRGDVYEVDKLEETTTDRDLKQELLDADFQEFWRAGKQDRKCSNASQISFGRMTPTDGASLNEYNFDDVGQFAEDGSFVGNYKD